MKYIEIPLRWLVILGAFIGVSCIIALMALTVVTVFFRAIGIAFPGTYALAEILLVPAITFSLAYAAYEGAHTRVELFVQLLPKRLGSILEALMLAVGTVFWVVVGYAAYLAALRSALLQEVAPIIGVSITPFRWLMLAAVVLLIMVLSVQILRALMGRNTNLTDSTKGH